MMTNMLKKLLLIITFIGGLASLYAQESNFTADRPGAATGTDILSQGVVQWETGIGFDAEYFTRTYTLNNTLFRFGVSKAAEIRIGMDWLLQHDTEEGVHEMGVSALNIGTKVCLYEGDGWIPTFSVLANLEIPHTGTKSFCPEHLAPSLYLLVQHDWCDWLNVGYNVGFEWDGSLPGPYTFAAISFGFAPTDKLGCFIEGYGNFKKNDNSFWSDFGISWMAAPRVQLDVAAYINLLHPNSLFGVSAGVAWQINQKGSRHN